VGAGAKRPPSGCGAAAGRAIIYTVDNNIGPAGAMVARKTTNLEVAGESQMAVGRSPTQSRPFIQPMTT
jgi:hypothetical protein